MADHAQLRPGTFESTMHRVKRRRRMFAGSAAAAILIIGGVAGATLIDRPLVQQQPVAPDEKRGEEKERRQRQLRIETHTLELGDQPLALAAGEGSIWVTVGMRDEVLEIRRDRIVARYPGGGVGLAVADGIAWQTTGGDGAEPDGTLTAIDVDSGALVQEVEFPGQTPYGVDVGPQGVFTALSQGHLVWLAPGAEDYTLIPLANGLTEVLVAHGAVWVSQPGGQNPRVWRVTVSSDDSNAAPILLKPQGRRSCPQGLAATGDAVWVADPCARVLWKLDRSGNKIGRINRVGNKPVDVAAGPRFLFVSSFRGDRLVTLIDRRTENVVANVQVGPGPSAIAAQGTGAWVANSEARSLTRIVPRTGE